MKQGYVEVNNIPTSVTTWGTWVDDKFTSKELILCIPGNPGCSGYYNIFLETLHKKLGLPVWIVGHSGHEEPEDKNLVKKIPPLKNNEKLYDTSGQIEQKAEFIRRYIPRDIKLHMVGHSIGTYMILQLMKKEDIRSRIISSSMLFPTIYNLPGTPLGVFCKYFVEPILPFVIFLSWVFTLFPYFFAYLIVYLYFLTIFVPKKYITDCISPTLEMIKPSIIAKVFHLGLHAIDTVQEIDADIINNNKDKFKFYYGSSDLWVPVSHCKKLSDVVPTVDAQVCGRNFNHGFVVKYPEHVGEMVADWITSWRSNGKITG